MTFTRWARRTPLLVSLAILAGPGALAAQGVGSLETECSLYYRSGSRRVMIKRLLPSQSFQGTSMTRDGNVFLAYSGSGDEATTVLSVYDVGAQRERIFIELGATGETQFAYDSKTGLVAFDWENAIYVFPLDAARQIPSNRERLEAFKKLLVLVTKCEACFQPRWTKDNRIAYLQYGSDGAGRAQYVDVPAAALAPKRN